MTGGAAEPEFVAEVDRAIAAARRQGAFLQLVSTHLTAALWAAGIRSAPLKGPTLGERIYGDPGRRASTDVDLLVAPEQLREAVQVIRGLGYAAPRDHAQRSGLPLLHFAMAHLRKQLPPVELHWRVHWYEDDFARERLLPEDCGDPSLWQPSPADELAALCLFYARDGFVGLRLAADLGAWWDTFGERLQPGALDALLGRYPALGRVLPAAVRVAERVVGIPAGRALTGSTRGGLRQRVAVRLANPHPHTSVPQIHAEMGLIDGLLAPPGGIGAFVARQLLPPREVLLERALTTHDRRGSSRLGHGCRVLIRYCIAAARLLRPPELSARRATGPTHG